MRTRTLTIDPHKPDVTALQAAAAIIRAGGLVAFPTETVYGIGADAFNGEAVRGIFAAKGRPADNPLIVHIASPEELQAVTAPSFAGQSHVDRLARRFWPGPLTVVVPKGPNVPDEITAGLDTVAVRMPDHPVALALIRAAGRPLAAPSANRSGRPSPTEAAHVQHDLAGRIDMIVDGGVTPVGLESTVLDLTVDPPLIHRPGAVTVEALEHVLGGPVQIGSDKDGAAPSSVASAAAAAAHSETPADVPRSPGVKYAHYAPRTRCVLVEGAAPEIVSALHNRLAAERARGRRAGVLATREGYAAYGTEAAALCIAGPRDDVAVIARNLYRCLRQLDEADVDIIYIEGIEPHGIGAAVMNRMRRAAGHKILHAHTL